MKSRALSASLTAVLLAGSLLAGCSHSVVPASSTISSAPVVATDTAAPTATSIPTPTPTPTPTSTPTPTPTPTPTSRPAPTVSEVKVATGTEPTISANPANGDLALVSQNIPWPTMCSRSSVRFSRNGGKTWSAPSYPWGRSCQDIHAVIAWGPNNRLWAGDAVGAGGGVKMSITYSDDYGAHWAARYVQTYTRAWVGCFPMINVDNNQASPTYGTLYVVYNWLPSSAGPGLRLLAKPLGGAWTAIEVPVVGLKGYADHNRIGYRVEPIAGGAVVSWYESDLKNFPTGDILSDGYGSNIGRTGFATARVHLEAGKLSLEPSAWATNVKSSTSLVYDSRWQSQLAVDDSATGLVTWLAVESGKQIKVGHQVSGVWSWTTLGISGQANFKPVLAIDRLGSAADPLAGVLFVGWHATNGSSVRNWYSLSFDNGRTWSSPARADGSSWSLPGVINGTGLRENAIYSGGAFWWAFGSTAGGGATAIHVAKIVP